MDRKSSKKYWLKERVKN